MAAWHLLMVLLSPPQRALPGTPPCRSGRPPCATFDMVIVCIVHYGEE